MAGFGILFILCTATGQMQLLVQHQMLVISEFRGGIIGVTLRPVSGADFVSPITDGHLLQRPVFLGFWRSVH